MDAMSSLVKKCLIIRSTAIHDFTPNIDITNDSRTEEMRFSKLKLIKDCLRSYAS
jgi:hypothetical protein